MSHRRIAQPKDSEMVGRLPGKQLGVGEGFFGRSRDAAAILTEQ